MALDRLMGVAVAVFAARWCASAAYSPYLVDLYVTEGEHTACDEDYRKIDHLGSLNGDFNQDAEQSSLSHVYIWLCVRYATSGTGITDLLVTADWYHLRDCDGLEGWTPIRTRNCKGDFNDGCWGHGSYTPRMYLCYSTSGGKEPIQELNIVENDCDTSKAPNRIQQGSFCNGDFNQGVGGKYIFMCFKRLEAPCTATKVVGEWTPHTTIVAPSDEQWQWGTEKKHESSNTEQWGQSVSVRVKQGWSILGTDGEVEITGEMSSQTSSSFSDAWTTNTMHSFTVHWTQENVGKLTWQFKFSPTDSCGNTEDSRVQEFAVTEGAWRPPCCVPGYATDAPHYKTCFSQDAMVAGGEKHGCQVAGQVLKRSSNLTFVV